MSNSANPVFARRAPVPKAICPMALAADALGDRWTLLILREAFFGVVRFEDIAADLDIARSVLSDRLNKMVSAGLLEQAEYREENSRARQCYRMTEAGRGTAQVLIALMQWGEKQITGKTAPIRIVDRQDEQELQLQLIRPDGATVSFDDAAIRIVG
jgi:DNA-binding HxlR family transcriptional regulator